MPSDKFRRQLRQEAKQWRNEELIDEQLYQNLAERYHFHELDRSARNRFILILLGLGSVLLGLAFITFVAANWQAWSREVKVMLLLSLFVGINTAGFYGWRNPTEGWQRRLGQGLLLLGSLILGATMALMSQMFHQSSPLYQLYLLWGLGVLAMAYSMRLTSLGVLALILIGLGHFRPYPEVVIIGELRWLRLFVQHMPILAGVMGIPLAYWCHSPWIFRLSALLMIMSFEGNLLRFYQLEASAGIAAIACILPPALFWAYDDTPWKRWLGLAESFSCNRSARTLAVIFLSILFYFLSFHRLWTTSLPLAPLANASSLRLSSLFVDSLVLGSLAMWEWLRLARKLNLTTGFMAIAIAISGLVTFWHLDIRPLPITAVWLFNLLLFLLAAGLVREGLAHSQRRLFWGGMVLLTLQILTRVVEYNTGLLFKSLVLFLCGFGIVAAGLWFERHVRTLSVSDEVQ